MLTEDFGWSNIKSVKNIVGLLFVFFCLSVSLVQATTVTLSSYNWSSTLGLRQTKILGLTAPVRFERYMFGKNLIPGSPFYFVKPWQERIQLALTFDQKNKNNLMIQIAGERLGEIQQLASSDNFQAISFAANSYRQTMTDVSNNLVSLSGQNENVTDLLGNLETETAKHNVILEQVRIQVPNQADAAVGEALKASWKGTDTVADLNNRPAIPDDLVARLQSLQSQGLLSSQEVNKLIGVKSRAEARQEVGKYVKEGVVSPSDFISLNETSKSLYPDEFYKIHETMRFQEMQRLEEQKPSDTVLNKIQAFAKTYNPGDQVPVELRKYWVPVVRLEEIQNTLRPDLIDASLFKTDGQDSKKFNEIVERFKPRPEDLARVNSFISKNNVEVGNLPVEYQRMYNLSQKYGAQCGAGFNWVSQPQSSAGGYCVPNGANISGSPASDDFVKNKTCNGSIVNAKGANGACSSFPSDCIPAGFEKVDTCVAVPVAAKINCPSNSHFVPVAYDPNGGYCIPNYTQTSPGQSPYPSTYNNPYALPSLTTTPGGPYYIGQGINGPSPSQPRPGGVSTPTRESQEAACRSGGGTCVSWVNEACGCVRASDNVSNPPTGYGSCPSGQFWTGSNCQVETAPTAPSSPPASEPAPVAP